MIARLIKDSAGKYLLLCPNGTIEEGTTHVLGNLFLNHRSADKFSGTYGKWNDRCFDMSMFPGETIAYVSDNYEFVSRNPEPFVPLIQENYRIHKYLTVEQYAQKHNKSKEIIKVFCREGRLIGAAKKGGCWIIPEDTPYPVPPQRRREGYRGPRKKNG